MHYKGDTVFHACFDKQFGGLECAQNSPKLPRLPCVYTNTLRNTARSMARRWIAERERLRGPFHLNL